MTANRGEGAFSSHNEVEERRVIEGLDRFAAQRKFARLHVLFIFPFLALLHENALL
jgi:hypothetical protein